MQINNNKNLKKKHSNTMRINKQPLKNIEHQPKTIQKQ